MYLPRPALLLATLGFTFVAADILGPTYPAPSDLSSSRSLVRAAWQNVSSTLDAYLKQGKNASATKDIAGAEAITFSAGLFSLHDEAAASVQYHYTASQIANSQHGTHQVDGDSIYRVASVSKLMTVFAGQIGLTDEDWNTPVTKFIPELIANVSNPHVPEWNKISLWALASHLSGIQSVGAIGDLVVALAGQAITSNTSFADLVVQSGLNPADAAAIGPCVSLDCTTAELAASSGAAPPIFPPYKTPVYSDFGIMLLGLAISRITNKPFDLLYQDEIFESLNMTSSFANAPTSGEVFTGHAVVAGPINGSWAFAQNNYALPSGGILSTINDLNKLGIGILNSTLLSPERTARWMKPHSHSASFSYSMGAPWEIVRYINKQTGKITDVYAKLGDSGAYGGILALIPDYDAGFTFLNALYEPPTAKQTRGEVALRLINHFAEAIISALEAQAAEEARCNFVGGYTSSVAQQTSILAVAFNESNVPTSRSGLSIQSWVSNGTDMIQGLLGGVNPQLLFASSVEGYVTFQASINPQWTSYEAAGLGPFSGYYDSNFDLYTLDGPRYAGGGLYTFTFGVDEMGRAVEVRNGAARMVMRRQS